MTRELLRSDLGSEMWLVSADDGSERYEVKCENFKLQIFETAEEAEEFFDRWAPEVAKEIDLFD
jgi:hypothetical protein